MQRNLPMWIVGAGLCALASSCMTLADDDGPTLAIDLYWDSAPEVERFVGETCFEAGVEWMEWTLYRVRDGERIEVDSRSERCADVLEVVEPRPGDYELDITGLDRDDQPLWQVTCGEQDAYLTVVRFDVAYVCDIVAP